ncbi:MAG TPA: TauD/TfdA family dioxygenase [Stellaceae bacterium]|nr:TauD/TfdA family dioxygenase [Stellaceae bacterium]
MPLEFHPLQGDFVAEIVGAPPDLRVDEATLQAIEAAWFRHSILVFRELDMTPQDHIGFTRRLGKLHVMVPTDYNLPGHPEIFVVGNAVVEGKPLGLRRAGMGFHTDGEDKLVPNAGSFLHARAVPPTGGDTLFADMYAVHAALPPDIRRRIAGRRARFSRAALHAVNYPHLPPLSPAQLRDRPDVWHPLERRHPRSFRVALYIGRWACDIEGLPEAEGREIVAFLQEFARQERFVYRHHWLNGDAVLWDNRCTQHCATMFDEARHTRLMHRTTLEGDAPIMA